MKFRQGVKASPVRTLLSYTHASLSVFTPIKHSDKKASPVAAEWYALVRTIREGGVNDDATRVNNSVNQPESPISSNVHFYEVGVIFGKRKRSVGRLKFGV